MNIEILKAYLSHFGPNLRLADGALTTMITFLTGNASSPSNTCGDSLSLDFGNSLGGRMFNVSLS